jgi:5-methyltetrahydrofolate--homocysteine methyltransferase
MNIIEELLLNKPVLLDGSWGTGLQKMGLIPGHCPDEWNLTNPDLVFKIAESYVNAGSRIILTNTFRSNAISLKEFNLQSKIEALNKSGVEISKRAASGKAKVFASIGPSGKMLLTGEISESELENAFTQQAEIMAGSGADGIVIETMTDLKEAVIALKAVKKTNLPAAVCLVFDSGKDKDKTMMGDPVDSAAGQLADNGADIIGANCGQGIEGFIKICSRLKNASNFPVWIKPNAGIPEFKEGRIIYSTGPEQFASYVPGLINAGADFIGGCCGTNPEFIKMINEKIRKFKTEN